jgi:hypothetical protein
MAASRAGTRRMSQMSGRAGTQFGRKFWTGHKKFIFATEWFPEWVHLAPVSLTLKWTRIWRTRPLLGEDALLWSFLL